MLNVKCSEAEGGSGIYCIICIDNDKWYIGSSSNIYNRISVHKKELKKNKHPNKYLQESWNKYGIIKFEFYVIEYCNKKELLEREQFYVNLYKTHYSLYGFNQAKIISGNSGYSFTEEQRKKVSDGLKKKLEDVEWKKARQVKTNEYARSDEGRKQHSETSKKMWQDPIIRNKIIEGLNNHSDDDGRLKENLDPIILAKRKEKLSIATKEYFSDPVNRQKASEDKKEYFSDPLNRQKTSEATSIAMNTTEMKDKISIAMKKFNVENPERVAEIKEARLKTFTTKEYREKASKIAKELWATDEHRNKMITERKERFSKQENRDKMKEISNDMWNDPVKYKEVLEKRSNITQEQFEQLKELHKLGYSQVQIAKVLDCKREAVGRICRGDSKLYSLT